MLDKNYLLEIAKDNFPDLASTNFNFNNSSISAFTEKTLLPFLIYQNTVDINNRLIGLFLPEKSNTINLLPFYAIMAHYRKALNKVMQTKKYENLTFRGNEKQVVFDSDVCDVSSVDFINRQLVLRTGGGRERNLSFNESYKIGWNYKNAQDLCSKIDSFDKIDKAKSHNIFTFPFSPTDNQYEGVIIFTNTSKFESLLRNIKISKNDIRNHINIEKVVFPKNGIGYNFKQISFKQTTGKPVSVLVARLDAFRAFADILVSGGKKYEHIKTIVIDEFDVLLKKWERSDKLIDELDNLKDSYFKRLPSGNLKDIYLICKNSSLNIHELFEKYEIDYNPWLVKPLEACMLNNEISKSPEISITNVGNLQFENLNQSINILIKRWKELAKANFCNGEILTTINSLYELRIKVNTFYDPDNLGKYFERVLSMLSQLKNKWFISGQDFGLIFETKDFITKCEGLTNFKLDLLIDFLKKKNINGCIKIVSDNMYEADINWMKNSIQSLFSDATIFHSHKNASLQSFNDNPCNPDIIFYLAADKNILGNALGNVLAKDQVFILNNSTYSFGVNFSKKYQKLQIETGSSRSQYHLLNIDAPKTTPSQEYLGIIPLKFSEIVQPQFDKIEEVENIESDINDWAEEIMVKHKNTSLNASDNYILFFDDGTFEMLPETKHIYLYEEESVADDIEKALKTVSQLEAGDKIILPKRGTPVKDLLEETLKKNEKFSKSIDMDSKWRILIYNHIQRCKMDLNYFRRKLRNNGFNIDSDLTIQHWIEGVTRQPSNFRGLLNALVLLEIINIDDIDSYYKHTSILKTIQFDFVKTAINKLISRLNGIEIEYDEIFTDELLNSFIDHIEIKNISSIHKL